MSSDTKTEDASSQVDGATASFVTAESFLPDTLAVFVNGQRLRPGVGNDFVETSANSFDLAWTLAAGEALIVQYETVEDGLVVAYPYDPTV